MYYVLKSNVIKKNNHFPLDGNNRVGEMIYIKKAHDLGFNTIVLIIFISWRNFYKQNKNINLSSISWLYEREKWS